MTKKKKAGPISRREIVILTARDGRRLLVADPYCDDGCTILEAAFKGRSAGAAAKSRLKDFKAAFAKAKDDNFEYCVMVWGLNRAQRTDLVERMKNQYKLEEAPKAAK